MTTATGKSSSYRWEITFQNEVVLEALLNRLQLQRVRLI